MNKVRALILGLVIFGQNAFCFADEVGRELGASLKDTSNEPGIMSVIFSLVIVICLIYVTGLIYSKLNLVGAKTVKEQLKKHELSTVAILSTTQLGQNKNLHVIEVDNKKLLIGATAHSINLIKELPCETIISGGKELVQENKTANEQNEEIYKKYL